MKINPLDLCSTLSREAGEQIIGTASHTRIFFLLEYPGVYSSNALEESTIPEEVKGALTALGKGIPGSKTLLIKQSSQLAGEGIRFYVAIASEKEPTLYLFNLADYQDLLPLDFSAMIQDDAAYQSNRSDERLFLVCTNGRRDPCCVRSGLAVFGALQEIADASVWQCSHVGGHRFAANVYALPHGMLFGRVGTDIARDLAHSYLNNQVWLDNLRGRSCYLSAVQAGEFYLRQETGMDQLEAFSLLNASETQPGHWSIQFHSPATNRLYKIGIHVERTDIPIYESCSMEKQTRLTRYHRVEAT